MGFHPGFPPCGLYKCLTAGPGHAHNPVIPVQQHLIPENQLPEGPVRLHIAVDKLDGFCAVRKAALGIVPHGVGYDNIRPRADHAQQVFPVSAVARLRPQFFFDILYLDNGVFRRSAAAVVVNQMNSRVRKLPVPLRSRLLRQDSDVEFLLIQQQRQIIQRLLRAAADQAVFDKNNLYASHCSPSTAVTSASRKRKCPQDLAFHTISSIPRTSMRNAGSSSS